MDRDNLVWIKTTLTMTMMGVWGIFFILVKGYIVFMENKNVLGDGIGSVTLIDSMPRQLHRVENPSGTLSGDQRIVDAARVSIAGDGVKPTSDDRKLIRYLVKNRHTTPLEQVTFAFHVRLPIFCARQWIRHRTGSFNEESARYGELASDFYVPSIDRLMVAGQSKKNKQGSTKAPFDGAMAMAIQDEMKRHFDDCYSEYKMLLEHGLARELARCVLPVSIYTQWYWKTDLHNLMHFLKLRIHPHAQWEMRQYAEAILPMAEAIAPYAMEAWKETL